MTEPNWKIALEKLYRLTIYIRWLFVLFAWLTLGSYGFWQLRGDYQLWRDYFTWTAVRYALAFNPVAAFCLFLCLGLTGAVLIRHSLYLLFGISSTQQEYFRQQAQKIYSKGATHPFYTWVYKR